MFLFPFNSLNWFTKSWRYQTLLCGATIANSHSNYQNILPRFLLFNDNSTKFDKMGVTYYEIFNFIKSMKWINIIANRQLKEPLFFDIWRKNVVKIGLILQDLFLHSSVKNQFQKLIDPSLEREFYSRSNDICLISFWNDWKKHLNTLLFRKMLMSS